MLASRFSPLRFDPEWTITDNDVDLLLEAAHWAPSAGNSQPWAYSDFADYDLGQSVAHLTLQAHASSADGLRTAPWSGGL